MWHHYWVMYWRNAFKQKLSTALNIVGLVIGLASALAMSLFIESEFAVDRFVDSQEVHRVVFGESDNTGSAYTPFVLGTELENSYPGVKAIRFNNAGNARANFKRGDKQFTETAFYFTDAEALQVFPFQLISGDKQTCLVEPFTMVITKKAAQKFFADANPVGQSISMKWIDQDYEIKITGLLDEDSFHSHLSFDYLISIATAERLFQPQSFFTDWTANFNVTYLFVENHNTANEIDGQLSNIYRQHLPQSVSDFSQLRLQPLERIHLYSHLSREISTNSDIKYIYLALGIGILVLIVCLINYTNLMSALFTLRLKEIGVRKSLGAARVTILKQFLIESMSNVVLALLLASVLVALLMPMLTTKLSMNWTLGQLIMIPGVWISIVALLIVGFVVGLYPSLVMAKQNAGEILYGRIKMIMQGTWLKNCLMVLQIFIAVFILVAALVARKQLQFMEVKDLGYSKESMLTIPHGRSIREKTESVKREMMQTGSIVSATLSSQLPSRGLGFKVPAIVEGGNPNGTLEPWPVSVVSVDFDFFQTFGLRLKEGRTFSTQFPSDSTEGFVINEAMVRVLNWSSPIGKEIEMTYNVGNGTVETRKGHVIGVINDFNFESLHKNIEPVVFIFKPFWFYYVTFRLTPGATAANIDALAAKWKSIEPDAPFEYSFMTDRLEQLYVRERAWASGVNFFSVIAIAISSLGLLGLISFMVQTRMREIAVRKILGAGINSIFLKLYGPMLALILFAFALALPVGWYACTWWLNGFAYRIDISLDVFVIAALTVILVSTISIASRILKAAHVNPVDVLKMQ